MYNATKDVLYVLVESSINGSDKRRFVHPSHTILWLNNFELTSKQHGWK